MMKMKHTFLFVLSLVIVCLLYRADFIVAIAAAQNTEETGEPAADSEPEKADEPAADSEPEKADEPAADSEPERADEPAADSEPEKADAPIADPEPEKDGEPAADLEPEKADEPIADSEPEKDGEPAAGPETEESGGSAVTEDQTESVSTGRELTDWLESHKNSGGTVKLGDHIVLAEDYDFYPSAPHMPAITVDTDRYTITVTGAVGFSSDNRLLFSGHPDGKGIFCVAEKGLFSAQGITVESQTCALWQEEGAGLVVSGCQTTGSIHYAETPFVMEPDPVCVVVEKGQTAKDVLPESLCCRVNRRGEVNAGEQVPLVWNLDGTKRQQEERLRFQAQGFFQQAVSLEPVRCTVVYNDYPMTFEEVHASVYGNCYMFKGYYTKPEEESPYTLKSEYSYDAENWLVSDEMTVDNTYAGFVIVVDDVQSDRAAHPYIYIRLQYNNNGTRYFSNVLCYAADNLDVVEDIGGNRGGGTSITNPPDEPQEEIVDPPSEEEKPEPEPDRDNGPDKDDPKTADAGRAEKETRSDAGGENDNAGLPTYAVPEEGNAGQRSESAPLNLNKKADQPSDAKAGSADAQQMPQDESPEPGEAPALYAKTDAGDGESAVRRDPAVPDRGEAVEVISAYGGNGVDLTQAQTLRGDNRRGGHMVIAAGVVLLSAAAGAAGFYARSRYSRSGTKR